MYAVEPQQLTDKCLKSKKSELNFSRMVSILWNGYKKYCDGMKMKWKLAMVSAIEEIPNWPWIAPFDKVAKETTV